MSAIISAQTLNTSNNYLYISNATTVTILDPLTTTIQSSFAGTAIKQKVFNPNTKQLFILSGTNLLVYNGTTNALQQTVAVGSNLGLAINLETNIVYIIAFNSAVLTIVNCNTFATSTLNMGAGVHAASIAVNSLTNLVYVADSGNSACLVINGLTVSSISVPVNPSGLVVNQQTGNVYLSNITSITVISSANVITATIPVANPIGMDINSITNFLFVVVGSSNVILQINCATNVAYAVSSAPANTLNGGILADQTNNTLFLCATNGIYQMDCNSRAISSLISLGYTPLSLCYNQPSLLPSTGSSSTATTILPSFISVAAPSGQVIPTTANSPIIFPTIIGSSGSSIAYNNVTGMFSLAGGYTYKLTCGIGGIANNPGPPTANSSLAFCWYDSTLLNAYMGVGEELIWNPSSTNVSKNGGPCVFTYTPSANTTVQVNLSYTPFNPNSFINPAGSPYAAYAIVEQMSGVSTTVGPISTLSLTDNISGSITGSNLALSVPYNTLSTTGNISGSFTGDVLSLNQPACQYNANVYMDAVQGLASGQDFNLGSTNYNNGCLTGGPTSFIVAFSGTYWIFIGATAQAPSTINLTVNGANAPGLTFDTNAAGYQAAGRTGILTLSAGTVLTLRNLTAGSVNFAYGSLTISKLS